MPKLTKAQQQDRRRHILTAAELCFARTGFQGTSMQAICREAGISAGALYLYFDSKEALIEGLVERERERGVAQFTQLHTVADFVSGIELMVEQCGARQSEAKTALFLEVVAESMRNPAVRKTMQTVDHSIKKALGELLVRAKQDGAISATASVDTMLAVIMVIFDGLTLRRSLDPDFDVRTTARLMLQMIRMIGAGSSDFISHAGCFEPNQILEPLQ